MSVRYEDTCVGCPSNMGCIGNACPNKNVPIYVCDHCYEDIDGDIYEVDGEDLCEGCLKRMFLKAY